jgi:hypothetical protein
MQPFFDKWYRPPGAGHGHTRSLMLEKFKEDVDSVLFGTDSLARSRCVSEAFPT